MNYVIHRWIMIAALFICMLGATLSSNKMAAAKATLITIATATAPIPDAPIKKYPTNGETPRLDGATQALPAAGISTLTELVDRADLILRGRVVQVQSGWQPGQRLIESIVMVHVAYTFLGNAGQTLTLHTPGGYLPAEGIGMSSMHAADFVAGEEVLLFLHQAGQQWQMVEGAAGKFRIQGEHAITHDGAWVESFDSLLATVAMLSEGRDDVRPAMVLWRQSAPTKAPTPLLTAEAQTRNKWPTPHATASFYLNLNSSQIDGGRVGGSRSDFRNAIIAAANRWSGLANVDFALRYGGPSVATTTSYNGVNEILFMHKGVKERAAAAEVWYKADQTIVEADIWINDDIPWDTTGTPAANEVDLQSALVHEFGHWLILAHTAQVESVMFPRLTAGTVKRELQGIDIAGISAIYPR